MSSGFEKINYTLRPNKSVERKMMCEALGRLSFIQHLNKYRYIGFGSPYFTDFILFHRNLGIKKLVSIEKEESKKARFDFNIPYSGIEMKYGQSTTVLPNLGLDKEKNIVWLDYDDKISDFMFSDIDTFFFNSMPGSFFIISINVEQDFPNWDALRTEGGGTTKDFRLKNLTGRVGKSRIPAEFMQLNMTTKNLIKVTYEMIRRQIATSLINRNGANKGEVEFKQLFNFVYKDNATILTVGGLLFDSQLKPAIAQMAFNELPFVQSGEQQYRIKSPNLTYREAKALDKVMPNSAIVEKGEFVNEKLQSLPLIQSDIENYAKIYRYYPTFTEANL